MEVQALQTGRDPAKIKFQLALKGSFLDVCRTSTGTQLMLYSLH